MNYREQLKRFSNSVFSIGINSQDTDVSKFVEDKHLARMSVYRNNLLIGLIDRLSEDFIAVKNYLGENNFRFFVRNYLIERSITSPNISDVSKEFPDFLISQEQLADDKYIADLARIDLFYSYEHDTEKTLELTKGITNFWQQLVDDEVEEVELKLDRNTKEQIRIKFVEGERVLVISAV